MAWPPDHRTYDFNIQYVPESQLKLVDGLSRRPYRQGESGNKIPLLPKRDRLWDDDCPIDVACTRADDDTWIPYMKKRFGDPVKKSSEYDSGFSSDSDMDVAAICEKIPQWTNIENFPTMHNWMICALDDGLVQIPAKPSPVKFIRFAPLTKDAVIPQRPPRAARYNLFASAGAVIRAGSNAVVPTDIEVQIPKGMYGTVVTPPQPAYRSASLNKILVQTAVVNATGLEQNLGANSSCRCNWP